MKNEQFKRAMKIEKYRNDMMDKHHDEMVKLYGTDYSEQFDYAGKLVIHPETTKFWSEFEASVSKKKQELLAEYHALPA